MEIKKVLSLLRREGRTNETGRQKAVSKDVKNFFLIAEPLDVKQGLF